MAMGVGGGRGGEGRCENIVEMKQVVLHTYHSVQQPLRTHNTAAGSAPSLGGRTCSDKGILRVGQTAAATGVIDDETMLSLKEPFSSDAAAAREG